MYNVNQNFLPAFAVYAFERRKMEEEAISVQTSRAVGTILKRLQRAKNLIPIFILSTECRERKRGTF